MQLVNRRLYMGYPVAYMGRRRLKTLVHIINIVTTYKYLLQCMYNNVCVFMAYVVITTFPS